LLAARCFWNQTVNKAPAIWQAIGAASLSGAEFDRDAAIS
jgi:hypothetical protein